MPQTTGYIAQVIGAVVDITFVAKDASGKTVLPAIHEALTVACRDGRELVLVTAKGANTYDPVWDAIYLYGEFTKSTESAESVEVENSRANLNFNIKTGRAFRTKDGMLSFFFSQTKG